jgi:hypothetical protein
MKSKLLALIGVFALYPLRPAAAWNPIRDVQEKLVWTLGEQASLGTAYKIAGGGNLENGKRGDSAMFGIFDYRFLKASYGAISDPANGSKIGDGLKAGLKLNYFLGWFKSPQTPVMAFLNNINVGPTYTVPLLSSPRSGILWVEANYSFEKAPALVPASPSPVVPVTSKLNLNYEITTETQGG